MNPIQYSRRTRQGLTMKKKPQRKDTKIPKRLTKEQIRDKVRKIYPENDGFGGKDYFLP